MKQKLLISEAVPPAAIGTLPGDAVAGHSPEIFIHASLTNGKSAPALPIERKCFSTAMACRGFGPAFSFPVFGPNRRVFHIPLAVLLFSHNSVREA